MSNEAGWIKALLIYAAAFVVIWVVLGPIWKPTVDAGVAAAVAAWHAQATPAPVFPKGKPS